MAIDSHLHVNGILFKNEEEQIEKINKNSDIEAVVNVGLNFETSSRAVEISEENKKFYCAVGIHPLYVDMQDINYLYYLAENPKVVAIGEIGLDSLSYPSLSVQKDIFINQIHIANELELPVIIHANNTNEEVVRTFENYVKPKFGCVFHCFQPDLTTLYYLIENNFYISFAGKITYANAKKSHEVIKKVPNSLFLVETDSPYIAPEPFRNSINEAANLKYIIKKVAEIKDMSYNEIETITSFNAKQLFRKMSREETCDG